MKKNIMNFFKIEKKLSVSFLWLVVSTILITFWLLAPSPVFANPGDQNIPVGEPGDPFFLFLVGARDILINDEILAVEISWTTEGFDVDTWEVERCYQEDCIVIADVSQSLSFYIDDSGEIEYGQTYRYTVTSLPDGNISGFNRITISEQQAPAPTDFRSGEWVS